MSEERRPEIRSEVAAGVTDALVQFLSNEEAVRKFWRKGFDELSSHTAEGASQWIGRRILTWLIAAMTTAGLIWLVKSGAIK